MSKEENDGSDEPDNLKSEAGPNNACYDDNISTANILSNLESHVTQDKNYDGLLL